MKSPAHYARWVRTVHGLDDMVPLDVDLLADKCGIPVHDTEIDSFLGLCLRIDGRPAILLDSKQIRTRRRFTLAHELGHACIPTHHGLSSLKCVTEDLSGKDANQSVEQQANDFAAELLVPRKLLSAMLSTGEISLRQAEEVSATFDVSLTCASRRLVEHCKEAAALVMCEGGNVSWCVRRHGFPYGLHARGTPIPVGTVAWDVEHGSGTGLEPLEVEPSTWLPEASGSFTLIESAIKLGSLDQVISLLWIPDLEGGRAEED